MKRIFVIVFILLPLLAQASGIKVSPSRIDIITEINKPMSGELIVVNPTADVQIFEIYPDEFPEIIKANPASFTLEAGAKKTVAVTAYPAAAENVSRVLRTDLSVVGKPLIKTRLQTNTGVKIPITVVVGRSATMTESDSGISLRLLYIILNVVSFGAIIYLIYSKNKRRNNRSKPEISNI